MNQSKIRRERERERERKRERERASISPLHIDALLLSTSHLVDTAGPATS